jgi:spermidine synthase
MDAEQRVVGAGLFCLGVSALVTQVLVLREFLNLFAGNELVLGLILGNWLLLTGLGTLTGRWVYHLQNPRAWLIVLQALLGLLPVMLILLIRLSKTIFPAGVAPGLGAVFCISLVLLLPYCLLAGFALVLCARLVGEGSTAIGQVYVWDMLGGMVGGLAFSFLLVFLATPVQTAILLLILNWTAALLLAWNGQRPLLQIGIGCAALAAILCSLHLADLERKTAQILFPGLELIRQKSTPYGHLALVRQGDQLTAYASGQPIGSTDDLLAAEEMVHFALCQHPAPQRVLMIGGGLRGAVGEVGKYPVERIDYVELDPALIELAQQSGALGEEPRLHPIAADARRFLRPVRERYDAILVGLPPPSTAQLNRFYTAEFFTQARRAIRPGGVFGIGIGGAENYASERKRLLSSSIHRSLAAAFPHVLAVPGAQLWLIASDRPLSIDIADLLLQRGVETRYVNADYLEARLASDRLKAARALVSGRAPLNRDFAPIAYYAHLRHWLDQFGGGLLLPFLLLLAVVMILLLLAGSVSRREVAFAVGASGFAGMGLEVLLLLAFQICFGHVYGYLSLVITAFMSGSALGAWWGNRQTGDSGSLLFRLDGLLGLLPFGLVPLLVGMRGMEATWLPTWGPPLFFALLNGAVGWLVGAQLPAAARLLFRDVGKTAGHLFACDLLGACAGALSIGAFCIPLLGVETTCYLLGGTKLLTAGWLWRRREVPATEIDPVISSRALPFGAVLFAFVALGGLIVAPDTSRGLYAFTFTPAYHWLLLALAGWGILQAMGVRLQSRSQLQRKFQEIALRVYRRTRLRPLRWLFFLAYAPVVFYPIFRCYFTVPFLFCHVCPRLCVFGFLRPYLVPAALLMNLEKRHWCHHACPLGTLYQCQADSGGRGRRLSRWLFALPLAMLGFTTVGYFEIERDMEGVGIWTGDWYAFFFKETFSTSGAVIASAAVLLIMGFRWRRSFCDTLCPVGTFSELWLKIERRLPGRVAKEEANAASTS